MTPILLRLILATTVLLTSSLLNAAIVKVENFDIGLNTGFEIGSPYDPIDQALDWFVFDSDGVSSVSFYFNRTVAQVDLIASLYAGDTYGFDYEAAGLTSGPYSQVDFYNTALTYIGTFDDSHDDFLDGPYGDPDFDLSLPAGRYSLMVFSVNLPGTYEFTTNVRSAYAEITEPSTIVILVLGILVLAARAVRSKSISV